MKNRLIQWTFVIIMGIIFPSVIIHVIPKKAETENFQPEELSYTHLQIIKMLDRNGDIIEIELEEYVLSVVLAEMPADFEVEALKAQAVLARTYVVKRVKHQSKHSNAHVCADSTCCQGFISVNEYEGSDESLSKVTAAVKSTAGQVLSYGGDLIDATYFSCSGGRTENAAAVWGTDVPYLKATDSPGEEQASQYLSTVVIDQQECLLKLGLTNKVLQINDVSYTEGGGVNIINICGKDFSGVQIRQLLGLKSTAFRMNLVGNNVIITVKGYGHRVGMSQYGADAMASQGYTYDEILTHYYSGTELLFDFS